MQARFARFTVRPRRAPSSRLPASAVEHNLGSEVPKEKIRLNGRAAGGDGGLDPPPLACWVRLTWHREDHRPHQLRIPFARSGILSNLMIGRSYQVKPPFPFTGARSRRRGRRGRRRRRQSAGGTTRPCGAAPRRRLRRGDRARRCRSDARQARIAAKRSPLRDVWPRPPFERGPEWVKVRRISTAATQPVILRQRKCARTDDKACQCKLPTPGESPNHPRSRTLAFIEPEAYAPHRTVAAAFGGGSPCRLSGPSPSPRKPARAGC